MNEPKAITVAPAALASASEAYGAAALMPHARQKGINLVAYYIQNEMTISSPYWVISF